jgi:hypothetical protein
VPIGVAGLAVDVMDDAALWKLFTKLLYELEPYGTAVHGLRETQLRWRQLVLVATELRARGAQLRLGDAI